MKNVEPQKENQTKSIQWKTLPLFADNVEPHIEPNDKDSDLPDNDRRLESNNVEPQIQTIGKTLAINSANLETKYDAKTILLKESEQRRDSHSETDNFHSTIESVSENFARRRKSAKKPHSQKRVVVTNKFFTSPEEKQYLQQKAKESGESFSNYIRFNLGLTPNTVGRKKQKTTAAFELDLDD